VQQPLTVYHWPESAGSIQLEQGLLIIAIQTPPTMLRTAARQQVRLALQEVLAAQLACSPAEIELFAQPGQALNLLQPTLDIALSISHEPGLSLAAVHMHGAVGVDLMAINSAPVASELHTLATDYLGHNIADHLARTPAKELGRGFAQAWTEFEARLKCTKEHLSEWNLAREKRLAQYGCRALSLPDGYVGTVAFENLLCNS